MRGSHRVQLYTKDVKFDFTFSRQVNIVTGNSGTGKTTFVDLLEAYNRRGGNYGISLICDKKCFVLRDDNWEDLLPVRSGSIIFIDATEYFYNTKRFAKVIKDTDNYYVIFTRESLSELACSIDSIFELNCSNRYVTLKRKYDDAIFATGSFEQILLASGLLPGVSPDYLTSYAEKSVRKFAESKGMTSHKQIVEFAREIAGDESLKVPELWSKAYAELDALGCFE